MHAPMSRTPGHHRLGWLVAAAGRALAAVTIAMVLTACAGGPSPSPTSAGPETPEPSTTSPTPDETTPTPDDTIGVDPPGPPGPTVPDVLQGPVVRWFRQLAEHHCRTLLTETTAALPSVSADDGSADVAYLYRAAANACLQRFAAARADLALVDLGRSAWQDTTCQPQLLSEWVSTYLDASAGDRQAADRLQHFPQPSERDCRPTDSPGPSDDSPTQSPVPEQDSPPSSTESAA